MILSLETMGSVIIRKMYILGWDSDSDDGHTVILRPVPQCKLPPGAPGVLFHVTLIGPHRSETMTFLINHMLRPAELAPSLGHWGRM